MSPRVDLIVHGEKIKQVTRLRTKIRLGIAKKAVFPGCLHHQALVGAACPAVGSTNEDSSRRSRHEGGAFACWHSAVVLRTMARQVRLRLDFRLRQAFHLRRAYGGQDGGQDGGTGDTGTS